MSDLGSGFQNGLSHAAGKNAELMSVLIEHLDTQARQMTRAVEKTSSALEKIDARLMALEKSVTRSYPMRAAEFVFFIADGAHRKRKGLLISFVAATAFSLLFLSLAHLWPDITPMLDDLRKVQK